MKFIILDRDGVINHDSHEYIKSPDEWHAIPGSLQAISDLNRAGFHVLIVTNQSGISRGYYDLETLSDIHEKLVRELAEVGGYVDEIFFCPHHPNDHCLCRKPKLGMIEQLSSKYPIDLSQTYFIGDSETDIEVAQAAGCKPLLVLTGNGEKTLKNLKTKIPAFQDLTAATQFIVNETTK